VSDRLDDYRRRRDFGRTPEPASRRRRGGKGAQQPRFVVQEHHARRLHWDLRLEHDGALASWAVPNGIPDHPKRNRKAIRTEDHPLSYLDFEGEIPKGEYGAGTMSVWDTGTYEAEKFRPDEVILTFHGERLTGRYALFQTDGRDWMIHRMDPPADPGAQPPPTDLKPMMAVAGDLPGDERGWGYEIKWDGVRALARWEPGRFSLRSRNGNDITARYPELRALGLQLGSATAVLDGEVVALDERGVPSFERLQQRMHLASEAAVRRRATEAPVTYVIFDLLHLEGHALVDQPYSQRRERLRALELEGPAWRTPAHRSGDGAALLDASREQGLEGIVAKRLDSRYEPGRRSPSWVKVKHTASQELVIGGWVPGRGRRDGRVGGLLVGVYDRLVDQVGDEPQRLVYAGRVGSGLSEGQLDDLTARLEALRRADSPFVRRPGRGAGPPRDAVFVEPELVAAVQFREWTAVGSLRAPVFKGLRDDRDPREVVREDAAAPDPGQGDRERTRPVPKKRGGAEIEVEGRRLKLTNLDKVLYPRTGFTKGDLIEYHRRIAEVVLPHLRDRPLTLKRYPDGVEGEHFYEKQCPSHRPDWVATTTVWSRHTSRDIAFCLAQDVPTLMWLGNLADLELHTSLARASDVTQPTMVVFDLDPGPPAGILECARVALRLRDMFDALGLSTVIKTSGSKGMQAYVPLNTTVSYEQTKPFAQAVAELMAKRHPDEVVSTMSKPARRGKVFVDWSQNDEHKTTVNVYSLRARDRPTVSTPLRWEEVEAAMARESAEALTFDYAQVLTRVERDGDLFEPALSVQQRLPDLGG
jgi:bifunctional non-homologous end joining protein LigD